MDKPIGTPLTMDEPFGTPSPPSICPISPPVEDVPPTPTSVTRNGETEQPLFFDNFEASPLSSALKSKGGRRGAKAPGYSGIQKPKQARQVRFKSPIAETLLIEFESSASSTVADPSPTVDTPVVPGTRRTSGRVRQPTTKSQAMLQQTQYASTAFTFGKNHIPQRYPTIAAQEKKLHEEEAREEGPSVMNPDMIELIDRPTLIAFSVPRSKLPSHSTNEVNKFVEINLDKQILMHFFNSTPAGVFLYSHVLTFGKIMRHHVEGAWAMWVKRHKESGSDSWVCFLNAGLVLAKEVDDPWFEQLVVAEMVEFLKESIGGM